MGKGNGNKIRKNDVFELRITDINNMGFGVGRHAGFVVFVADAVIGEVVRARAIKVGASFAVARAEEILETSAHRTVRLCPHKSCGGCAYQSLEYEAELAIKREFVAGCFKKVGITAEVAPVDTDGKMSRYRNKGEYPVGCGESPYDYKIGFYAPHSHRIIECEDCLLQPSEFSDIIRRLKPLLAKHRIPAYREEDGSGVLRHIYLRRSEHSGEIFLTLVVKSADECNLSALAKDIRTDIASVTSLALNINPHNTNVICTDDYRMMWGTPYITDKLCGVSLRISPASFYQVNRSMAERIYIKARELSGLDTDKTLADLFCGVGSIGLSMADSAKAVYGIEINEKAVVCARENAELNGIANAEFFVGDAANAKALLSPAFAKMDEERFDAVLLDPPRKGTTEELINYLCTELKVKTVVYISCNPETLARDARRFIDNSYCMGTVYPYNLFPRTGHTECVTVFTREKERTKDE